MTRNGYFLVFLYGLGTLAVVWVLEYFGYAPCQLCLWQRYPWWLIMAMALGGVVYPARFWLYICGLLAVVGAGLGIFHAGVEWQWWNGLESCATNVLSMDSDLAMNQLFQKAKVSCGKPALIFLGLSLAGWNIVANIVFIVFILYLTNNTRQNH